MTKQRIRICENLIITSKQKSFTDQRASIQAMKKGRQKQREKNKSLNFVFEFYLFFSHRMRTHGPLSMFKTVQVNHYSIILEKSNISNGFFILLSMYRVKRRIHFSSFSCKLELFWIRRKWTMFHRRLNVDCSFRFHSTSKWCAPLYDVLFEMKQFLSYFLCFFLYFSFSVKFKIILFSIKSCVLFAIKCNMLVVKYCELCSQSHSIEMREKNTRELSLNRDSIDHQSEWVYARTNQWKCSLSFWIYFIFQFTEFFFPFRFVHVTSFFN